MSLDFNYPIYLEKHQTKNTNEATTSIYNIIKGLLSDF
jgi:hypothetical protein